MSRHYQPDNERRSGRTTRLALHFVQLVLDNPGVPVEIDDHADYREADRQLFGLVYDVLTRLRVPCTTNKSTMTIQADGPPQPFRYPTVDDEVQRQQMKDLVSVIDNKFRSPRTIHY